MPRPASGHNTVGRLPDEAEQRPSSSRLRVRRRHRLWDSGNWISSEIVTIWHQCTCSSLVQTARRSLCRQSAFLSNLAHSRRWGQQCLILSFASNITSITNNCSSWAGLIGPTIVYCCRFFREVTALNLPQCHRIPTGVSEQLKLSSLCEIFIRQIFKSAVAKDRFN